jgi:abortive infection bacteriophage resistance protein
LQNFFGIDFLFAKFATTESATLPVDQRTRAELLFLVPYKKFCAYASFKPFCMSLREHSHTTLSIPEIIFQLQNHRGLLFADEDYARRQLEVIGYFRLRSYLQPLESDKNSHSFKPGSTFESALDLYYFDKELRALLFTAIQSVEVGIRTQISHPITMKYGAYWYLDPALSVNQHQFSDNLRCIHREINRSKEDYIRNHFIKYQNGELPVWKYIEISSLTTLSKIFSNFSDISLKKNIARSLGLPQHKILGTWIQGLTALRNCIAHHSRVWNRIFPGTIMLPKDVQGKWISNSGSIDCRKLYAHICFMAHLQNRIHPKNNFAAQMKGLLEKYPNVDTKAMGFPPGWKDEKLWR